jgi:hypothetical protein
VLADATAAAVLASVAPPSVLAEAAAAAVLAEAALPPVLADAGATTAVLALGAPPPVLADAAGPPQSLQRLRCRPCSQTRGRCRRSPCRSGAAARARRPEAAAAAVLAEAALPPVLADAATTAVLALGAHPPVLADAAVAGPPQSLQYRIFATPAPIFACLSNALPISLSKSMPLALIPPPDLYYMPLPRAPAELASKRFIVFLSILKASMVGFTLLSRDTNICVDEIPPPRSRPTTVRQGNGGL